MKITDLRIYQILIPLKKPFRTALSMKYNYEGVIVRIDTDEGIYGYGEASPSLDVTGETQSTVLKSLNEIKQLIINENPLRIEYIMDKINYVYGSAAKTSIDIALHDIFGKKMMLPIKDFFGQPKNEIKTSVTIGISNIEDMVKYAIELVESGVENIKIKIGLEPEKDIETIKKIRDNIGYGPKIRVDANQGYTVETAITTLKKLEKYEIEFVEQPVNATDILALKEVKKNISIPVMADEAVHTVGDAIKIIKNDAADMMNIKLMKSGLTNGLKIAEICSYSSIPCMVGCMIETRIGITAGTHLALGNRNIVYADLDGHLDLRADICTNGVITNKGINKIENGIGLSTEVNEKLLSTLLVKETKGDKSI